MRGAASRSFLIALILLGSLQAQSPPPIPLTLVSREGRRPVPTTMSGGQELVALDDVASLFQVAVREDTLAGGLTIAYHGRTIVLSTSQPMASVNGRVIALPSPAVRSGRRWLVPVEFLPRALGPVYDLRIDLRRQSRLLIVGDLKVPRVTARIDATGPPTRATLEIAPASPVTVATEAGRLVVRVEADALDLGLPGDGAGLIDAIRAGDLPGTIAVMLDGRAGSARAVPAEANGVTRVAIEVAAAEAVATPSSPPAATPSAVPSSEPPAAPIVTPARQGLLTIVIDPGHGGADAGVRGAGGLEEKQVTLDVARRLRTLIEMRLGIRVVLTRDDDKAISLDDRAALANNSKADLFLSLHANGSTAPAVAGAEVYHLRLDREGEEARRAAETEAVSLPVLGGARRTIDVIRWDLAQARHVDRSATLASLLEEGLRAHVTMSERPRREAPLRVLTGVNMPAALIEMAYLTNAEQERQIRSDAFQAVIAQGIYEAVLRFRASLEEPRQP